MAYKIIQTVTPTLCTLSIYAFTFMVSALFGAHSFIFQLIFVLHNTAVQAFLYREIIKFLELMFYIQAIFTAALPKFALLGRVDMLRFKFTETAQAYIHIFIIYLEGYVQWLEILLEILLWFACFGAYIFYIWYNR